VNADISERFALIAHQQRHAHAFGRCRRLRTSFGSPAITLGAISASRAATGMARSTPQLRLFEQREGCGNASDRAESAPAPAQCASEKGVCSLRLTITRVIRQDACSAINLGGAGRHAGQTAQAAVDMLDRFGIGNAFSSISFDQINPATRTVEPVTSTWWWAMVQ
jgi:hypothetical protein